MATIPQTQSFKLFGAGASIGATSITLQSFKNLDGSNLTITHFGGTKGFLTIEPNSGTQEEQVSFASITNNANGTVTLGTIKNVLDYTPFTETAGLAKTHGGNVEVIVSNTSGFYNNIVAGATAAQITNTPAGNIAATDVQSAINELDTEGLHKAGSETVTGVKTFSETVVPRISAAHSYIVGEEEFLTTKRYVDNVAGSAVVANASTTVKGITEEATDAEVLASATTGGTGARLFVNPGSVGNAANKIPFVTSNGKLDTTIMPNLKFGGTGADGALSTSSGTTNIDLAGAQVVIKNYTSISITGTANITFSNPHANGTTIIFKSQGAVTISSSATRAIDLRDLGGLGGSTVGPNSGGTSTTNVGCGGASVSNNGSGGGSASAYTAPSAGNSTYGALGIIQGGATNSDYTVSKGLGIPTGLNVTISKVVPVQPGSGGSSAFGPFNAQGMAGGRGAGALYIECAGGFTCSSTIDASGTAGTNATGSARSGYGGGAGAICILYASVVSDTGTYTITGGAAGTGGAASGDVGGAGYVYRGLNTEFV